MSPVIPIYVFGLEYSTQRTDLVVYLVTEFEMHIGTIPTYIGMDAPIHQRFSPICDGSGQRSVNVMDVCREKSMMLMDHLWRQRTIDCSVNHPPSTLCFVQLVDFMNVDLVLQGSVCGNRF